MPGRSARVRTERRRTTRRRWGVVAAAVVVVSATATATAAFIASATSISALAVVAFFPTVAAVFGDFDAPVLKPAIVVVCAAIFGVFAVVAAVDYSEKNHLPKTAVLFSLLAEAAVIKGVILPVVL
jgi:drug/metabolite transporter (DMT)-like permease